MTRILLVALSVAGRRAKQPTGAPNASHHGAAKIQIAAATCRTKATSRAGVWENYGTRPTRHSRHPGDVPVGLDPQFSMSKKNNGRNPAVNTTADRVAVCAGRPRLNYSSVFRLRRKELHYYNFIGNNNDSLMNVLGCSPIMCGAVMHTAGILVGLKKKKHEDCYDMCFL